MKWHIFLDVTGELRRLPDTMVHGKPAHYANSCHKYWTVDLKDRPSVWKFCVGALACGAKEKEVMDLALGWNVTNREGIKFALSMGVKLQRDKAFKNPQVWIADFGDQQGDEQGRGPSALHALVALAKAGALRATIKERKKGGDG